MTIKVGVQHCVNKTPTVIITGASSGIGKAQAVAFLNHGAFVIVIDKAPISIEHQNILKITADISQKAEVDKLFEIVAEKFSQIDVLCNTAGILDEFKNIENTDIELWDKVINTNVRSMFLITKAFIPLLLKAPSSRIINMASIAGLTTAGGGIAYTVSKHAVIGFTKQLAYEYQGKNIRINGIAPGAIRTKMTEPDFAQEAELARWVQNETPIKRWAEPAEVANLTLFLASDQADYMHGTILTMDGGWTIKG
ncbi:2-(R)-hydroxypropyl-CoM dehydrogenase [Phocoenobacter uteri]|uniref:2-(R)-hydroxypropyl-CoM dehydrogenase n=1 Tax=Phocoenobacter uteri TaxID=146806 RepID=A0A379CBN5_9PAST|nr:3-oxoacyl-ACP reductase [Phocoenobacter uteri]MDG6881643.1 NAD(P)-dependent dehydrogenase [Phocoenobacter uteri]SUB59674.1 2-(R)-hydroxypropyl-CoM dehydrogenase [Phocoenobacter uteri]